MSPLMISMSLISVRARKEKLYKSLSPKAGEAALISEDERSLYGVKKLYKSLSPNTGGAALISEDERSLYGVKKLYKSLSPKAGEAALISEDEKKSLQVMQKFSAKMKKFVTFPQI